MHNFILNQTIEEIMQTLIIKYIDDKYHTAETKDKQVCWFDLKEQFIKMTHNDKVKDLRSVFSDIGKKLQFNITWNKTKKFKDT